jgi:phosphatidylinositol glycan class O
VWLLGVAYSAPVAVYMWRQFFFLFVLQSAGILFFLKGFLLTRNAIPEYSPPCHSANNSPCHRQIFKKSIWLLLDGLRYDFIDYDPSWSSHDVPFHINQMTNMRYYLQDRPQNAKLFHFKADPPTTTMQRVKGLTTGSLPTYMDIMSNFNSYEIQEDNVILQLKKNNRRIAFMGDNTWMGMYSKLFDKSYPALPLDVKDVHTVDNLVIEHLIPEIKSNQTWDVIIGHFLGVDHCGHTYGPNSHMMKMKLIQLDKYIKKVFETVDNDTIIFVFGDHGMTETGEHAGETDLETGAALLVYSPRSIFNPHQSHERRSIYQTDLVPTVSLLHGIPIPFSSIGMIIPDLFTSHANTTSSADSLSAFKANADQLNAYINAQYHHGTSLPSKDMKMLSDMYNQLDKKHLEALNNVSVLNETINLYLSYMKNVRKVCSISWVEFDLLPMVLGVLILTIHIVVALVNITGWDSKALTDVVELLTSITFVDVVALVVLFIHSISLFSNSFIVYEGVTVVYLYQTLLLALMFDKIRTNFSLIKWIFPPLTKQKFNELLAHREMEYLCWSSIFDKLYSSSLPFIKIMICVHLTSHFHVCRDQQLNCTVSKLSQRFMLTYDIYYLFYIVRYFISIVIVIFTFKYAHYFLANLFVYKDYAYKKFNLPRCFNKVVITCMGGGFSIIVLLVILSYDVVPVWLFRLSMVIIIGIMIYGIYCPFEGGQNKYDESIASAASQADSVSLSMAPYSWLLLLLWIPIIFIVVVANDALYLTTSLSIIQFLLIMKMLQETPQGSS